MKILGRSLAVVICAFSFLPSARAQTVSCTIDIPVFAAGTYDARGEHDTRSQGGAAGFGALAHVRGPYHSFDAFHIPSFAGTVTNATLMGSAYTSASYGFETL